VDAIKDVKDTSTQVSFFPPGISKFLAFDFQESFEV